MVESRFSMPLVQVQILSPSTLNTNKAKGKSSASQKKKETYVVVRLLCAK
jgi:hypothetical protein